MKLVYTVIFAGSTYIAAQAQDVTAFDNAFAQFMSQASVGNVAAVAPAAPAAKPPKKKLINKQTNKKANQRAAQKKADREAEAKKRREEEEARPMYDRVRDDSDLALAQAQRLAVKAAPNAILGMAIAKKIEAKKLSTNGFFPEEFMEGLVDELIAESEGDERGVAANNCQGDCNVPVSLSGLWGYGCWCHFENDLMRGHGQPVNVHDIACQAMQYCLRCSVNDLNTCDPATHPYTAAMSWFFGTKSLEADCEDQNSGDECATHMCMCQMKLVSDLIDQVWLGYTYQPQYRHPDIGGSFSYDDQCL